MATCWSFKILYFTSVNVEIFSSNESWDGFNLTIFKQAYHKWATNNKWDRICNTQSFPSASFWMQYNQYRSKNIWTSMSEPAVTRKIDTFQLLLLPEINVTVLESRQSLVIVLGTAGHLLVCKWNRLEGLQGAWIPPPPDSTATGCLEICSVHYKGLFWFPAKQKPKYKHTVSLSPHTCYS